MNDRSYVLKGIVTIIIHFLLQVRYCVRSTFKQKTAYEIYGGLVGSEMCIRDRCV